MGDMSEGIGRVPARWRQRNEMLRGPRLKIEIGEEEAVFIKGGLRRSVEIDDMEDLWKTLTNDMELNEETAERVLDLVAAEAAIASGEAF